MHRLPYLVHPTTGCGLVQTKMVVYFTWGCTRRPLASDQTPTHTDNLVTRYLAVPYFDRKAMNPNLSMDALGKLRREEGGYGWAASLQPLQL